MEILKRGCTGSSVKLLQEKLHLIKDGIFGALTEEAVKNFQTEQSLAPDGIVGLKTWEALNKISDNTNKAETTLNGVTIKKSKRVITLLACHCSATPEGKDYTTADIKKWHLAQGWSDIGYHYVIYRDGTIHLGRDVDKIGSHIAGHNSNSIGICYIGGLDSTGKKSKDTRTPEQKKSFILLLTELKKLYPTAIIRGHRDYAKKDCPCFDAAKEYSNIEV